jgi:Acetyltransferase (GNAT) domain
MYSLWNDAVMSSQGGTLFHTTYWLEASQMPFRIYAVFQDDALLGGFVAPYSKLSRVGLVSDRPFLTPYTGLVIFPRAQKQSAIITEFKNIASQLVDELKTDFSALNVRLSPFVNDLQPFIWAGLGAGVRYTYHVDVSDLNKAWENVGRKTRHSIKRAKEEGLQVKYDLHPAEYLDLFKATKSKGTASSALIGRYHSALGGRKLAQTFGIYSPEGRMLSAVYLVWDRFRSYYLMGGFREVKGDNQPGFSATALAIWEAMRFTREDLGLSQFDLEGSMIPGVELFFRKFGGALVPFYTISWHKKRSLAHRLWQAASSRISHFRHNPEENFNG